nr:hypothetical protein [Immundisolibacter cernigliae]
MHQVRHVGDRLQRDLGAVEGATAGRAAGLQLLGATLLALLVRLALVLVATGLVEDVLDRARQRAHEATSMRRAGEGRRLLEASQESGQPGRGMNLDCETVS